MPVRVCLIGCGWIVRSNHGPALRMLAGRGEVELAACCDVNREAADRVREEVGFRKAHVNLEEMLDSERPDAVVVAVPDAVACAVGRQVIARGIPALLEKPPARTLAELDAMISLAKEKGVRPQVAFNRRSAPVLVEMKRRLAAVGQVHCVQGWMMRNGRREPDFGVTAVHLVDAVRFALGDDYQSLRLRYQTWHAEGGMPVTNFHIEGMTSGGVLVQLCICPDSGMAMERLTARCAGRTLEVDMPPMGGGEWNPDRLSEWCDGRLVRTVSGRELAGRDEPYAINGMLDQMAGFLRAVRERSEAGVNLEGSRQSIEVMVALRERAGTVGGEPTAQK